MWSRRLLIFVPASPRRAGRSETAATTETATTTADAKPMLVKRVLGNSRPEAERRRVYVYRLLYDRDPAAETP